MSKDIMTSVRTIKEYTAGSAPAAATDSPWSSIQGPIVDTGDVAGLAEMPLLDGNMKPGEGVAPMPMVDNPWDLISGKQNKEADGFVSGTPSGALNNLVGGKRYIKL